VSDSNKFVLIRSEGRRSVGKQLVPRTASTYQLLVKAPSWLHWDWLLKWWGCTATTRCSVIVGMQISSINETAGFSYCCIPEVCNLYYWRAKRNKTDYTAGRAFVSHRLSSHSDRHKNPLCCIWPAGRRLHTPVVHYSWCKYGNYIKQVNYIINNFPSHHKKRYLLRFIDDNNWQVIKLVFTYFALPVH